MDHLADVGVEDVFVLLGDDVGSGEAFIETEIGYGGGDEAGCRLEGGEDDGVAD
eukprot:CAMPEP_0185794514 /NCGR_PEP_ID=MMETSP1174-20130828/160056_1 /TAXON_ID=35687 /ORGANISM="Dictyocha speculum, Strain CCMP1381" /LENGTH=53 /DNA_ID=CAMNT_0028489747 /DNA_START=1141 /DNA_END=1299 /DNA_ORIENTATION=+